MSIVGPMYGFVAALFTRMSTRAEPLDRRGDARVGLVGLPGVGDASRRPRRRSPAAAASSASAFRDESITRAPLAASSGRDREADARGTTR